MALEVWAVAFGELDSHKSASCQEEKDKEIYEKALGFGIFGHKTIISRPENSCHE